jgi:Tol biopolymer transport system component
MSIQFGPWATSIVAGRNPQLSAFWRRRMTMLTDVSQTSPMLSRRNLLWLGAAGALGGALPTLRLATAEAEQERPAARARNYPHGRIFLAANLKTKPNVADHEEDVLGDVRGIIAVDPETGQWEKIVDGDDVRVSRDGKDMAFAKLSFPKSGQIESAIWTCDLPSRRASQVLAAGGPMFFWSPDGKQIVTIKGRRAKDDRSRNATWEAVNLDGSEPRTLPIPATDQVEDWSGDGKWFAAVTNRKPPFGRGYQLYRMHPDGSKERRLTKDGLNCYPRFSPDSRQIVYLHQSAKKGNSLRVVDVDGQDDREIRREEGLASVEAGCFSPDGRQVAVLRFDWHLNEEGRRVSYSPDDTNRRLEIVSTDGAHRRELPLRGVEKTIWLGHPDWR